MLLSTIIVVLIAVVGFHYLLSMSHERELNSLKKYGGNDKIIVTFIALIAIAKTWLSTKSP
jgi:hypothetical protein